MRIVALVPGGIGDQILFFPTLDDLKRGYPEAQIDVVVSPQAKEAYRISKTVRNTILFDFQGRNSLADFGNLLGNLRDREYDAVLSLAPSWTINFLLWLTGIPTRIGYAAGGQSFLTRTIPYQPNQYAAAAHRELLRALNLNLPPSEATLTVPAKDLDWANAERQRLGINRGYILIHGGTSGENGTSYPGTSWNDIIQDFQRKQPDTPIVLVRDSSATDLVTELLTANPALKVTSPTDVGKLAALIAGASLLISTDSTALQLAIAVQTYTLALFGNTDPRTALPNDKRFVGIQSQTGRVADIPPQTVLEKVWST